jgi:large subunit ribosomal protein L21
MMQGSSADAVLFAFGEPGKANSLRCEGLSSVSRLSSVSGPPKACAVAPGEFYAACYFCEFARSSFRSSHMYAVIKTGGKQYKVCAGEKIKVEQLPADIGQDIVIDQVLAVFDGTDTRIGTPLLAGAAVTAKVLAHGRGEKVRIFKMRRRKHYQKHQGHRQNYTELQIESIAA